MGMIEPRSGACERSPDVVDTTAPAEPAPPLHHPKHHWMVPRGWSEWIALVIILGVVAICAFAAGQASKTYEINKRVQEIAEASKQVQDASEKRQLAEAGEADAKKQLAAADSQLKDAFNAYRTIVLNINDTASVATGSFTVGMVGPPANDKVSINVNGTQQTVAAGASIDAGVSNCQVKVQSFDMFKVTLLTSCPPARP
jgi:Tfp pilus assembly major pilin PilA